MSQPATVLVRNTLLGDGKPKICVSITETTHEDILRSCKRIIDKGADLVEWRVDHYSRNCNPAAMEGTLEALRGLLGDIPLIFTIRTKNEGGLADLPLWDYVKIYRAAARTGKVDIFDVELQIALNIPKEIIVELKRNAKLIFSKHFFTMTPSLEKMVDDMIRMQVFGADIAKLAVMPIDEGDVRRLFSASAEMVAHHHSTPIITISMGDLGVDSRIQCVKTGSCLTFAAVDAGSAPGQLPIDLLRYDMEQFNMTYRPPKA